MRSQTFGPHCMFSFDIKQAIPPPAYLDKIIEVLKQYIYTHCNNEACNASSHSTYIYIVTHKHPIRFIKTQSENFAFNMIWTQKHFIYHGAPSGTGLTVQTLIL